MSRQTATDIAAHATRLLAEGLTQHPQAAHLLLLEALPAAAVAQRVLAAAVAAPRSCAVILCGVPVGLAWPEWAVVQSVEDSDAGLILFGAYLAQATMGTRCYVFGSEFLSAEANLRAEAAGMHRSSIAALRFDSHDRRVYCAHCKAVTQGGEAAAHQLCSGCGALLKPRSFFSARHQAYLGVADPEFMA